MRIFVVEDQKIILMGIRKMIENFNPGDEVYTFSSAIQALHEMERLRPQLVFTDIVMEGMDGLELIRQASQLLPDCRFVIISGFADFEYARQAISLGVECYLLKPIERAQLEDVLRCTRIDSEESPVKMARTGTISEEVMAYIAAHVEQPLSVPSIAAAIHISPNYLSNVFKKETGISITKAIRDEQMKAAERLVRTTNLYLYEIAERFGYKDVKYFSLLFKECFGMTPKNYRRTFGLEADDEPDD